MSFDVSHPEVREIVRTALAEDIGSGDVTSTLCIDAGQKASGRFIARQPMILAGVELLPLIYAERGGVDHFRIASPSGSRLGPGDEIASVSGRARTLLECERVSLNFMQRLSGVATLAGRYAAETAGTKCRILDTRKTTPGLRRLEKMAAAAGGVVNHRIGLFDAVLIKNNHITAAGGVRQALARVRAAAVPVEIEVRTQEEIEEALECGATHLLLDNYTPERAREAIGRIAGRATVELSGGIELDSVAAYAATGADFVSCGAVTHSAVAVDMNFRIELEA
jgi:nicotinate-nucleotide pyrophosphorylase (carboxylating)